MINCEVSAETAPGLQYGHTAAILKILYHAAGGSEGEKPSPRPETEVHRLKLGLRFSLGRFMVKSTEGRFGGFVRLAVLLNLG